MKFLKNYMLKGSQAHAHKIATLVGICSNILETLIATSLETMIVSL